MMLLLPNLKLYSLAFSAVYGPAKHEYSGLAAPVLALFPEIYLGSVLKLTNETKEIVKHRKCFIIAFVRSFTI